MKRYEANPRRGGFLNSFPWKLEPSGEYRDDYAAARAAGNAERLRVVAMVLLAMFSGLLAQHLLSPGVPRATPPYIAYLAIYLIFIGGSGAYLFIAGIIYRGAAPVAAHWFLVFLILGGSATLAVFDSRDSGDLTALFLGLVGIAVLFRCRLVFFLCSTAVTIAGFMSGLYLTAGHAPSMAIGTTLVIDSICTIALSVALGHYDIRTFSLQKKLEEGISERDALFQELQHRVKNSLGMVSSLLSLDEQRLDEGPAKETLRQAQARIQTMSAVYERLYRSGELGTVDFAVYAADLVDMLLEANAVDAKRIGVTNSLSTLRIELKRAIPLGLILNELFTNSIKHAFPGSRSGRIEIRLEQSGGRARLTVQDDGVGLPAGFSAVNSDSLGMKLIDLLTEQIGAEHRRLEGPGTGVEISFAP